VTAPRRAETRPVAEELPSAGPLMRSPIHRMHQALEARLAVEGGWEVPAGYASDADERRALDEAVGLADITARGKVDLRGTLEPVLERLGLGGPAARHGEVVALAPGAGDGAAQLARISSRWALALCPHTDLRPRLAQLGEAAAGTSAMVTDATSLHAGLAVAGPRTLAALSRICALDLARLGPATCVATRVAEIHAIVVRRELPGRVLEVYVGSEYGRYAWETLLDSVRAEGGRPVGWPALRALGWW
jgi:glycine cleavage system aminomethyltransferase T